MSTKTTFKGFTFVKRTQGRGFVPPPPARPANGLHKANNTSSAASLSKLASTSADAVPNGGVQTSITTFTNPPPAKKPVATVPPQGHAAPSIPAVTVSPSTSVGSTILHSKSAGNWASRKRKSQDVPLSQLNPSIICDLDDDDDFELPVITQVTPKHKKSETKENAPDSDEDEILPARKRRSLVLHSDDEEDKDTNCSQSATPPVSVIPATQTVRSLSQVAPTNKQSGGADFSAPKGFSVERNAHTSLQRSSDENCGNQQDITGFRLAALLARTNDASGSSFVNSLSNSSPGTLKSSPASVARSHNAFQATPVSPQSNSSPLPQASSGGQYSNKSGLSMSNREQSPISHHSNGQQARSATSSSDNTDACADVTKHPLLQADITTESQRTELQSVLLRVMDEVCDIICSASTAALMNLGVSDYTRLQTLLAVRKQIKDKSSAPHNSNSPVSQLPRKNSAGYTDSSSRTPSLPPPSSRLSEGNLCQTDSTGMTSDFAELMSPPLATSSAVKRVPAKQVQPVMESPVPCGDSFFEDISAFTQSHMTYMRGFRNSPSVPGGTTNVTSKSENVSKVPQNRPESPIVISQDCDAVAKKLYDDADLCFDDDDDDDFPSNMDTTVFSNGDVSSPHNVNQSNPIVPSTLSSGGHNGVRLVNNGAPLRNGANRGAASVNDASAGNVGAFADEIVEAFDDDIAAMDFDDTDWGAPANVSNSNNTSPQAGNRNNETAVEPYVPMFGSTDKDDGSTGEFDGEQFPHSKELREMFHTVFGLREFRHNQLQAINAALLGNDCFILMPTGGGKSLCYQLPALVTRGVSIIVSPLRALIQDQVQRLVTFDIPAAHLSGDIDTSQANGVYSRLYQREPGIKLLYVTPEKISLSDKLHSCLQSLYRRQLLDRFVIDEAHCVSQWGHDFRPDYKKLNALRTKYPGVPIMALTATATPRVRRDIIHQLDMRQPKWFMQSFNRPNLKYSVKPKKPSNATATAIEIIMSKFRRDCGIIYCLSRKECDTVAADLKKAGIEAASYHAGLSDSERIYVQERWLNGDNCKVICATIAFGMGIDKADVRFVIHYSLPKSVEGYYQEAGRAGRDGMLAHCILFYTYSDVKRLRRIIDMDQAATYDSKRVHIDNLFRMVQYCENVADCRRAQVLQYFGEHHFDRERCKTVPGAICDNCSSKDSFTIRDVTDDAKLVVRCVKEITGCRGNNYTLLHLIEIFKGSQNTRIMDLGHNKLALHGRGAAYSRSDAERLMHKLVVEGILREELAITAADTAACYVRLGPKAADLMQGKMKIEMAVQGGRKRSEVCRIGQEPQTSRQQLVEECYKELIDLAKTIASEHGSRNYALIFPNTMLWQLAEKTPLTVEEMKREIDGLPETKINKYGAHRLLDITTKYCVMLSSLADDVSQGEGDGSDTGEDWSSPYFDVPSTSTRGKKRGFARGRGGRGKGGKRSRGGSRKRGSSSKATNSSARLTSSNSNRGFAAPQNSRGKAAASTTVRRANTSVSKGSLGLMPDPRSRPYLASIGSYMG